MDHRLRCVGSIPKVSFLLLLSLLLFSFVDAAFDLATIPFNDGYSTLFGDSNVVRSADGYGAQLLLDRFTGKCFSYTSSCAITSAYDFFFSFLCGFFSQKFYPIIKQVRVSYPLICTTMDSSAPESSYRRIILRVFAWRFM